eukprot:g16007.t1
MMGRRRSAVSFLLAAAPAAAWQSGLRGPCLEMKNVLLSSSCDSGQQRTTRFQFTMVEQGRAALMGRCATAGELVTLAFNAPVFAATHSSGVVGDLEHNNKVTFIAEDILEFSAILDTTSVTAGTELIVSGGNFVEAAHWTVPECAGATGTTAYGRKLQTTSEDDDDCAPCGDLTEAQERSLAGDYEPAKQIVCDRTCLDSDGDHTHCNYFGLDQICRGCGDCETCTPCPGDDPDANTTPSPVTPAETPSPTDEEDPETPAPTEATPSPITPAETPSPTDEEEPETPAPTEATPSPVTPITPAPVTPAPVTPAPVTPAPVTPAPVTPAPVTPAETPSPTEEAEPETPAPTEEPVVAPDISRDNRPTAPTPSPVSPVPAPTPGPTPEPTPEPVPEVGRDASPTTPSPVIPEPEPTPAPVAADLDVPQDKPTEPTPTADEDDVCADRGAVCYDLTDAQEEALAKYDNGGKTVVCDPTCLDSSVDPLHCNYFGLDQVCRGCGACSDCTPCPATAVPTPAPTAAPTQEPTPEPTPGPTPEPTPEPVTPEPTSPPVAADAPVASVEGDETAPSVAGDEATTSSTVDDEDEAPASAADEGASLDGDDDPCAACSNITEAQAEALASYDNGGKTIVCDVACVEPGGDTSHCNYFGLGQICRGCGDCSDCTPCP